VLQSGSNRKEKELREIEWGGRVDFVEAVMANKIMNFRLT
jgi:hypothetical protein